MRSASRMRTMILAAVLAAGLWSAAVAGEPAAAAPAPAAPAATPAAPAATPAAPAGKPVVVKSITPGDEGIVVDAGTLGTFTVGYPALMMKGKPEPLKPTDTKADGAKVTATYEGGAKAVITCKADGITVAWSGLPAGAEKFKMTTLIDFGFAGSGTWQLGGAAKPFPADKPAKPHMFQGSSEAFVLKNAGGDSLTFTVPDYTFNELQDNREWNWEIFAWNVYVPFVEGAKEYRIAIGPPAPPPTGIKSIKATEKGMQINAGRLGEFTIDYPTLIVKGKKEPLKPIEKRPAGAKATVMYEGGAKLEVESTKDGQITLAFTGLPQGVEKFRASTLVDFAYQAGGTWQMTGGEAKPFPTEKPAKPHLFQGNSKSFTVRNFEGAAITFTAPDYSYNELTDNREWGWKTFAWTIHTPISGASATAQLTVTATSPAAGERKFLVDKFGQTAAGDWPGKIKTEEELKADVEADKAYYAALKPPAADPFGGLPGSGEKLGLKKTGFFHVEQKGKQWLLVDPAGNAFFHLGVCGMQPMQDYTLVKGREHVYEWIPALGGEYQSAFRGEGMGRDVFSFHLANRIRKSGKPFDADEYAAEAIRRVRAWGFNSGGAFMQLPDKVRVEANFPYVLTLPMGQWTGLPPLPGIACTWDPFDEKNLARVEKNFADSVAKRADDPLLIGYFLENEPILEEIPRVVPTLPGKFACKQRLVKMLREKYATIEAYNKAWDAKAASFDALADAGLAVRTDAAKADVAAFTELFHETYLKFVRETFNKYDRNHMLIGNRLQPGTIMNEAMMRLQGKYLDVISFNYYTHYLDKTLLAKIYGWTGGRPMILSEFYWDSPRDSGLPGGVKDVNSQEERGKAYRMYVEQAASTGFIVGIEWYTYGDMAATGPWFWGFNADNGNAGLVAVTDRPWKVMLGLMMETNYNIYDYVFGKKTPYVFDDPRFKAPAAWDQKP